MPSGATDGERSTATAPGSSHISQSEPVELPAGSTRAGEVRYAPSSDGPATLTEGDVRIIRELTKHARISVTRLSRTLGVPESTVRRRITDLIREHVLQFEIDVDPRLYGRPLEATCWLQVEPAGLDDVAQAPASQPQVAFAATTTGSRETALVGRRVKRAGAMLPGS